jgi:hypothetical protein
MRYRKLDSDGDCSFGRSALDFISDTPETVAQAVRTRLLLLRGEWFLDVTDGTPYATEILGANTAQTYDLAIRERILDTQGVTGIVSYESNLADRALTVIATIDTLYGQSTVSAAL